MLVVLSLITAVVAGLLVGVLVAPVAGLLLALLLLAAGITAQRSQGAPRRGIGLTLLLGLFLAVAYLSTAAFDVLEALNGTDGTAEAADAQQLAEARAQLLAAEEAQSFRLELTEPQLQAVVQDGVASDPDLPVRRLDIDLRGATQDIAFTASFKAGTLQARGVAAVGVVDGGVDLQLGTLDFGGVRVPGVASAAVQSVLSSITDLNAALSTQGTVVQSVEVTDDSLIVIGTRVGQELTGGQLLDAIRAQAASGPGSVVAPAEVLGPGTVDALQAPGDPMILALGDSLAAGVGVAQQRDGYVSRVHRALSDADGTAYGLQNLAVSGETSASMREGGQLAAAEEALRTRPTAYVLLDIGANDLLGHLQSADCGDDLRGAACQQRIEQSLEAYRRNLTQILDRLTAAAGGARVALLQTYNPFSLGLGSSEQEQESTAIIGRLNAVAAEVAGPRGVVVADGFTPMLDTTAATTHMLDATPDIHPNAAGYDVLATALFRALTG